MPGLPKTKAFSLTVYEKVLLRVLIGTYLAELDMIAAGP